MKKTFLLIISCFLTLTVSANVQPNSGELEKKIIELIEDFNLLDDFWYGDDGEDCGKPNFSISNMDFKKQIVYLDIYQGKDIHACIYHSPFKCEIKYRFKKGKLKLPKKVNMLNDCRMFY